MRRESSLVLVIVLALLLVGVLTVYSAGTARAFDEPELNRTALYQPLYRQLAHVGLGLLALFVLARLDYHIYANRVMFGLIAMGALGFLVLVLLIGEEVRGGRRWIQLAGFSFQPSEFAKFALIVILAVKLSENQERLRSFLRGYVPFGIITVGFLGLILLQRDLGIPVVLGAVALLMAFMAGARPTHVAISLVGAAAAVYALIVSSDYRRDRILAFTDPWQYRDDEAYQLIQSMVAFAQGGLWGRGPGASEQKLFYLPDAHTDFIFAIWAEEMGLIGSVLVVALFAVLLVLALRIAVCAPDLMGALLAGGIAALITVQAGFNMAVTTGLLPTKGLPLPFISAGGSSILANLLLVGVLLNVGLQAREPAPSMAVPAAG